MRRGRWLRSLRALAVLATMALAGCGSEKTFTAAEFVDRVDAQGVTLELGRRLPTGADADEVYAVTLPRAPGEPPAPPGEGKRGGPNGTLYVYGSGDGAGHELDACRASGGLLCFRAANIVVILDEDTGGIRARQLGLAIMRLRS